ncbi:hypothetical protein HAX54_040393 [Datura stramonium]|uniref:Uncharacterized protein n=1 Tax=Datura stramonium TaxID=4076 RepID=A0ABS8RQF2_DATST|nr:hypothetical protein [Datura stramonium]
MFDSASILAPSREAPIKEERRNYFFHFFFTYIITEICGGPPQTTIDSTETPPSQRNEEVSTYKGMDISRHSTYARAAKDLTHHLRNTRKEKGQRKRARTKSSYRESHSYPRPQSSRKLACPAESATP